MIVREMRIKDSDYSYILGVEFVIFSNGVTMSREEFSTFHGKGILVKKISSLARVPKRLFNYQVALETGALTPLYMPMKNLQLNPKKPKKKEITVIPETVQPEIIPVESVQPEKLSRFKKPSKSQIILFVMAFVAVGSACMSVYHSAAFLINNGKPFFIASMTAIFIVLFASCGFTAARYFSEKKGMAKIFSVPFIFITCVLICYIAFSTTSVSFTQFRDEEASKSSTVKKEISSLELYTDTQKSITETEKFIKSLDKVKPGSLEKRAYTRQQSMIAAEREKLQKLRDRAYTLKEKAGGGSIEEKKQEITSVYEFLTEIFGINSRLLRFIIYVIPAVFYDIVAPFGFTVVFFLVDTKEKEECDA